MIRTRSTVLRIGSRYARGNPVAMATSTTQLVPTGPQHQKYSSTSVTNGIREHSFQGSNVMSSSSSSSSSSGSASREMSTAELMSEDMTEGDHFGDLFGASLAKGGKVEDLVGRYAATRRTFGPRSNANVMLLCGGPELAKQASFDPSYERAKQWIQTHPVGPAVVSPVLTSGLVGTLVEAALPSGVTLGCSSNQHLPIIVGVEVEARATVVSVGESAFANGHDVSLQTEVMRTRDGAVVSSGLHTVWVPRH